MTLQKQIIDVPFTSGVDTKTDNFLASKLDTLENGYIGQDGTIHKRNGFDELSTAINNNDSYTGTNITSGELLLSRKDELLVAGKKGVFSYTPSETSPWTKKANFSFTPSIPAVSLSIDSIGQPISASWPMSSQMEETSTEEIYVINKFDQDLSNSTVYYSNITRKDKVTGASFTDDSLQISTSVTGNTSELIKLGTQVFWIVKSSASILAYNVTSRATSYPSQTLKTDAINDGLSSFFATNVLNNKFVLTYVETGGKLRVVTYTLSGTSLLLDMSYTLSSETEAIAGGFATAYDSVQSLYFIAYTSRATTNRKTKFFVLSSTFTLSVAITQINSAFSASLVNDIYPKAAIYNPALAAINIVFTEYKSTYDTMQLVSAVIEIPTVSITFNYTLLSCEILSRFSILNGIPTLAVAKLSYWGKYVGGVRTYTAYLANYFLKPIARISSSFEIFARDGVLSAYQNSSLINPYPANGATKVSISVDNLTNSNPIESDGLALVASGAVNAYDGATYSELGFTHAPVIYSADPAGSGSSVVAGAYFYRAVYEYVDSMGNYHLSDVSDRASIVLASATDVALAIEPYRFTNKEGKVTLKLYRKKDTDLLYKLVGSYSSANIGVLDKTADNSSNEIIYSDGGSNSVIVNTTAPATNIITSHGGRLFAVDEEDTSLVWYTKKSSSGSAYAFNDFFYFQIPENKTGFNERITGLASLDDKLIIFKGQSIYAVFGDGPNDSGQGSFSDPKIISTDVGCSEPRSIINLSDGVMFKSEKGIYLLSRSLEVSYIGKDVEAYNSLEITSACLLPDINQVRFTTRTGVALVFNYFYNEWSTFLNYDANHAVIWRGKWTHLKSSGVVREENNGFLDVAATIRLRVVMSWIKAAGIQSLQRIYRLMFIGTWKSAHNIVANISYDYENYTWDTYPITILSSNYNRTDKPTNSALYSGANDGIYNYQIHLKRQKCQAISFEIYDTDIVGESFAISSLSFMVGMKNGLDKVSSNKKF